MREHGAHGVIDLEREAHAVLKAAAAFVGALVRQWRQELVQQVAVCGVDLDAIEAQAFGFLAARGLKGLPLSYPATTGVPMPMTGGVIARP